MGKLINNLHIYARKSPKGYQPLIETIYSPHTKVAMKQDSFNTPQLAIDFAVSKLEQIKKAHF